jgi:hypothetical protein
MQRRQTVAGGNAFRRCALGRRRRLPRQSALWHATVIRGRRCRQGLDAPVSWAARAPESMALLGWLECKVVELATLVWLRKDDNIERKILIDDRGLRINRLRSNEMRIT